MFPCVIHNMISYHIIYYVSFLILHYIRLYYIILCYHIIFHYMIQSYTFPKMFFGNTMQYPKFLLTHVHQTHETCHRQLGRHRLCLLFRGCVCTNHHVTFTGNIFLASSQLPSGNQRWQAGKSTRNWGFNRKITYKY